MIEWRILTQEQADRVWLTIEDETNACIKTGPASPSNKIELIAQQVLAGHMKVMLAHDETNNCVGSAVVKIKGTTAFAVSVTGRGLSSQTSANNFFSALKALGVRKVEALCRPSAARLWGNVGFETKYHLMEVNIWADS